MPSFMYNQHANAKPLKHTFRSQLNGKNSQQNWKVRCSAFSQVFHINLEHL
ncbi:hypothetical protein M5D96_003978, partial [Drosophila gunungcola]